MPDNKLWEGHRIVLPELRAKAAHSCQECRFLISIEGQEETRPGCIAGIRSFAAMSGARLRTRVPEQITLRELLSLAGRGGLQEILDRGQPRSPGLRTVPAPAQEGRNAAALSGIERPKNKLWPEYWPE